MIARFYISLLQNYLEYSNYFNKEFIDSWDNEIKPFILEKFPLKKEGYFNVNSDIDFLIKEVDLIKEEFIKKNKETLNNNKNNNKNTNSNSNGHKNENVKNNDNKLKSDIKEKEKESEFDPSVTFGKRKGTQKKRNNIKESIKKIDDKEKNNNENLNLLEERKLSKIKMIFLELMQDNIQVIKRKNSMKELRPHSHTIKSNTTCDTSVIEENNNLNMNNIILNENKDTNNNKIKNTNRNNTKMDINFNINLNKNDNKSKKYYGSIFIEEENTNEKKKKSGSTVLRKTQTMAPIYKEEEEEEGISIVHKLTEKKITHIYTDIFLKKIIFENFINNNILLIYHFCQQCFCFLNKEIFFKKIFSCYRKYKNNTPKEKMKNLIEFVNILVIEMFEYYTKIDLHDVYSKDIKSFYNELITDLILSLDTSDAEYENNDEDDNYENNNHFRFESIDFYKNDDCIVNKNYSNNYNYVLNRKALINMNLNIENKDIKIFIFKEQEKDKEKLISPNKLPLITKKRSNAIKPKSSNSNPFLSLIKKEKKNIKENKEEDTKNYIDNNNNESEKLTENNTILGDNENEKDEKIKLNVEEGIKEQKKLYQISRTLRRSQIIPKKRKSRISSIIQEEEEQKERSDDDDVKKRSNSLKSIHSNESGSDDRSNNNSLLSEKESESESSKNEDNSNNLNLNKENEKKNKEEDENRRKLQIINNILELSQTPQNLITLSEKLLKAIQYILILFDKDNDGEPSSIDINEAKEKIKFYRNLQINLNKNKKILMIPTQRGKRFTKSYSTNILNIGSIHSSKIKTEREHLIKGFFCVIDWTPKEIGDKLIQISRSSIIKIHPRELYHSVFMKKDKLKTSPNVVDCTNLSNRLTYFIIEDIISYDSPKDRARMYERWLLIAEYCKLNKDYNDLFAIVSALNHYIITGLKQTLKYVSSKSISTFKQISEFCTFEGNYKNIREDINICNKSGIIFIPYLGTLLKDINFFEESSKYINENGCINFEKIEKIAQLFEINFKFKKVEPSKKKVINELEFFDDLEDLKEEELEKIANNIEPEFKMEKEVEKRLTNIDRKYFERYKKSEVINMRGSYMQERKTVVGLPY